MKPEQYMRKAIELAKRGNVSPNPKVGCVIVKDNKFISAGHHKKYGGHHAEVIALKKAGKRVKNATMYITLEPCSHYGKTPPCTKAIINAGIKEVIIAMKDPNKKVKGIEELKKAGIKVRVGLLKKEAEKINEAYIKFMIRKEPFVVLKTAMSINGKITDNVSKSEWITGKESRRYVHKLRDEIDAVLVGINTVLKDNPKLTCRLKKKRRDPIRVIVDSKLKIPLNADVLKDNNVIIATTTNCSKSKEKILKNKKIKIIKTNGKKINLKNLMKELAKQNISSVMIEGGQRINESALKERIVDKIIIFIAPKMIKSGLDAFSALKTKDIYNLIDTKKTAVKMLGSDLILDAYLIEEDMII